MISFPSILLSIIILLKHFLWCICALLKQKVFICLKGFPNLAQRLSLFKQCDIGFLFWIALSIFISWVIFLEEADWYLVNSFSLMLIIWLISSILTFLKFLYFAIFSAFSSNHLLIVVLCQFVSFLILYLEYFFLKNNHLMTFFISALLSNNGFIFDFIKIILYNVYRVIKNNTHNREKKCFDFWLKFIIGRKNVLTFDWNF